MSMPRGSSFQNNKHANATRNFKLGRMRMKLKMKKKRLKIENNKNSEKIVEIINVLAFLSYDSFKIQVIIARKQQKS